MHGRARIAAVSMIAFVLSSLPTFADDLWQITSRPAVTSAIPDPTAQTLTQPQLRSRDEPDLSSPPDTKAPTPDVLQPKERAQRPIWKFWVASEKKVNADPVRFLKVGGTYWVYLKLSKLNDGKHSFYEASEKCIEHFLNADSESGNISAEVLTLPDEAIFDRLPSPRGSTTIAATLLRRDFSKPEEVEAVEEGTEGLRGEEDHEPVQIHVSSKAKPGLATITFLIMLDGQVVEELVLPLCIGREPCQSDTPLRSAVRPPPSVGSALAAALTFVEIDDVHMTGVFWRPEGDGGAFDIWRFFFPDKTNVDVWIARTQELFKKGYSTSHVGEKVLDSLFPKDRCDDTSCVRARTAFESWVSSAATTSAVPPPVLVVRLLSPWRPSEAPRLLPMAYFPVPETLSKPIVTEAPVTPPAQPSTISGDPTTVTSERRHDLPAASVPAYARFLGENIFVYVPVRTPPTDSSGCVSSWRIVGPWPNDDDTKGAYNELQESIITWSKTPAKASLYNSSLQGLQSNDEIGGLIVVSHFDEEGLRAGDDQKVIPAQINLGLKQPAFVALLACGSGAPYTNGLISKMLYKGANTIIATPPVIEAIVVGAFVKCFEAQLTSTGTTVREVLRKTVLCMGKERREAALRFAVLGDPNLRLCEPGGLQ